MTMQANQIDEWLDKAFHLAFFLHGNRETAKAIVVNAPTPPNQNGEIITPKTLPPEENVNSRHENAPKNLKETNQSVSSNKSLSRQEN
ncbi:MAG: hypothetical protein LH614_05410 [Pyrinomonadaceae bacterium]|nr:hypothetical protein [Pyrinomonadaceae bacterium]